MLAYDGVMLREPRLLTPGLKPLGQVVLDKKHPVSASVWDVLLLQGTPRFLLDKVTLSSISGSPAFVGGRQGLCLRGVNADLTYAINTPPKISTGYTQIIQRSFSAIDAYYSYVFSFGSAATTANVTFGNNSSTSTMRFWHNAAYASPSIYTWFTENENPVDTLVISWQPVVSELKFFKNGSLRVTSSFTSTAPTDDSTTFRLFSRTGTGNGWDGDVYLYALIEKGLPEAMCASLSADPYQFLIPA